MKRTIIGKAAALTLAFCFALPVLGACGDAGNDGKNGDAVTLTVTGSFEECPAVNALSREFSKKNNCKLVYESIPTKTYEKMVKTRLSNNDQIDLFFIGNVQENKKDFIPYTLDLNSREDLDFSQTFPGLKENFTYKGTNELYSIPVGAHIRGMFVNVSLLKEVNIEKVPENGTELLAACKTLKEKGYVAFQGNPSTFAQHLLYPWVCNTIVNSPNAEEIRGKIEGRESGLSETFKDCFEFMYGVTENYYYDYLGEQRKGLFVGTSDEDRALCFLNSEKAGDGYKKTDESAGKVAFMPGTLSTKSTIDRIKEDVYSNIEYVFIPAPVSNDKGYVYLSPSDGIAINKNSPNLELCVKLVNFLFEHEVNIMFNEKFALMPNTTDVLSYVSNAFGVPEKSVLHLGQVTYEWDFYKAITDVLVDISKGNNPKYMKPDENGTVYFDGSEKVTVLSTGAKIEYTGNVSLYALQDYLNKFESKVVI